MTDSLKSFFSKSLREVPVLAFFLYLAYLCVVFHNRDHKMLDQAITFDQWWYFHHRLSQGVLAQWDPFTLLGKIAVQWNCIPLSVLFSPFLVFSDLTLDVFHLLSVVGTFLSLSVVYLVGRLLGYNRFISLLPLVILATSGYRYWVSRSLYANLLFFYPLSIVCLLNAVKSAGRKAAANWLGCIILLGFAFTSARLENMVYCSTFLLIVFVVLACRQKDAKDRMRIVIAGVSVIIGSLLLSAWQLSFLMASTAESSRISNGIQLMRFLDMSLLKWTIRSVAQQAVLVMLVLNLCAAGVFYYWKRLSGMRYRFVNSWTIFPLVFAQIVLLKLLTLFRGWAGLEQTRAFFTPNTHPVFNNFDLIFSWYGVMSILILTIVYLLVERKMTVKKMLTFCIALFAGFYVAEYSWHIWPININMHFFFAIPLFAPLIVFGAVRLMMRNRSWMLVVLVVFHFVGETGLFYLYEVGGIPWLAPRAALAELPFQIVLMLEGALLLKEGILRLVSERVRFGSAKRDKIRAYAGGAVSAACVLIAFLSIRMFLMPVGQKVVLSAGEGTERVYLEEFPFSETPVENNHASINMSLHEAQRNADAVRAYRAAVNPWNRVRINDDIVSWGSAMYYKFMPAYSRTLNTAPVYSSEIPKAMSVIFSESTRGAEPVLAKKPHPEMNPVFIGYKHEQARAKGIDNVFDYLNAVMILPHQGNDPVYREIMAEENSGTPRAFLTRRVVKLKNEADEYDYLKRVIKDSGRLTDAITTSDSRFRDEAWAGNDGPLNYNLVFERDEPECVILRVTSDGSAYLSLMDIWSRGWRAYVDRRERDIYRGYMGARFIELEKGDHTVEFRYRIPGLLVSSVISIVAWLSAGIGLAVMIGKKRPVHLKEAV